MMHPQLLLSCEWHSLKNAVISIVTDMVGQTMIKMLIVILKKICRVKSNLGLLYWMVRELKEVMLK